MNVSTVVEQLWAWLKANGKTVRAVKVGDTVDHVGLTRSEVEKGVNALLPPIVDEIVTAFDWDFACDVATDTSVVSQAEYTLRGNADDCRDIINIRYGSGRGVVIEPLNTLKTDRREGETVSGSSDTSGVYGYTLFGRSDDGFPKIQLFDTPLEAKTITYRYRKKDLSLADIPDSFGYVVRDFLRAEYDPGYQTKAEHRLGRMIARYKVGGDTPDIARRDPVIEAGNVRRGEQQGGC